MLIQGAAAFRASHTLDQPIPPPGITNAYDGFGRLASSSTNMSGTTRTLTYDHDRNSNRTHIIHPDGTSFDAAYDELNRRSAPIVNRTTGIATTGCTAFGALQFRGHDT